MFVRDGIILPARAWSRGKKNRESIDANSVLNGMKFKKKGKSLS